jgi:hypothetical protein
MVLSGVGIFAGNTGSTPPLFTGIADYFHASSSTTDVPQAIDVPLEFALGQNYPNPFNPSTSITFSLPAKSHVSLAVFNVLGQLVRQLVDEERSAGYHAVRFDASSYASGVYFYRMQVRPPAAGGDARSGAGSFVDTKKLLLLR